MFRSVTAVAALFLATLVGAHAGEPGQSAIKGDVSKKPNIVGVATGSPDHKILVELLQAADYVDFFANPGPFKVFAPTDAAFKKIPEGTLDTLKKAENKGKLQHILEYHVYVGSKGGKGPNALTNGETLNQANMENVKVALKGKEIRINDAKVLGTVSASNGWVHVVDTVLLPPEKK